MVFMWSEKSIKIGKGKGGKLLAKDEKSVIIWSNFYILYIFL